MSTKSIFLVGLLGLLLATACDTTSPSSQTEERPAATTEKATATFVANPQQVAEQNVETLPIGTTAPDFRLPGTDGKYYTLADFAEAKALVIVFTANHCPTAQAYEDRLIALANDYQGKGVQLVAISPNSPLGLLYEELGYTDLNDDYIDMQIRGEHKQFNFPYLYDGDSQETSLKYGPAATPHVYVFDQERKLRYTGRLDKVEKPGIANAEDLRAAIDAVLAGKAPVEAVTKTFGCSTKWGWKTEMKAKANAEWAQRAVSLDPIDEAGIARLLKNDDSGKLRLINVWATWCGPCIIEYPEFVVLQRMYGARDFEFVSISADKLAQRERAQKFLQEKQSALKNYIFTNEDKYALIEALGNGWNGALPYTVLLAPGGEKVWEHQGEVDFLELKRAIVEHPLIGRYY